MLLVHPDGADAALASAEGVRLLASGRPLLSVDVFQTGPGAKPVAIDKYFYSYNRSPPANRVQDILTALAFLHSEAPGRIELIGLDKAGVWCLFAAAVADNPPELTSRVSGFNGADEDFHNQFFVPGIQRAGGLAAALRLVPVRVESRIRSGWAWRLTNLVR